MLLLLWLVITVTFILASGEGICPGQTDGFGMSFVLFKALLRFLRDDLMKRPRDLAFELHDYCTSYRWQIGWDDVLLN